MSFDTNARRQAKELFDALMDRLVKDLSTAAREETEAAVIATRKEAEAVVAAAEKEADATVAATRKDAEATIAAARKDADAAAAAAVAAARHDAEETVAAARRDAEAAVAATQRDADAAVAAARREAEAAVAAARKEAEEKAARARAEAEQVAESQLAAARSDGEARLAAAQAMNAGLLESVEAARQEVKTYEALLQELESERSQLLLAKDEAGAHLVAETQRANELADALEAAVQEANLAKQTASLSKVEADARRQDRELALDRFGAALRIIDRATSPPEILDALLEPLAQDFAKSAVFLVGAAGLKGWRARGLPASNDIAKLVIPLGSDSLLTRALTTRKRVQVSANGDDLPTGLWGGSVANAVALPIQAGDGVIAVAYAEDAEETSSQGVGRKITEMLIKHAALRLTVKARTAPGSNTGGAAQAPGAKENVEYSPPRQARRLKMREGIEVVLDGSASSLVNMSSIGAQVLSPMALRPNRVVKMTLRGDGSVLACKVRVMWARFEPGMGAAQYRVGVKFTDLETNTVEAFMAQHGIETTREHTTPAKLKDSA